MVRIIIFVQVFALVASEGVFELGLLAFHNQNGQNINGLCCHEPLDTSEPCSKKPCSTFFRICLKQYQSNIDPEPPCTYGSRVTSAIQENVIDFGKKKEFVEPMKFPFSFAWPGTFSLIVEAWHNSTDKGKDLLTRVAEQRTLSIGPKWVLEDHTSGSSNLELQYRVVCAENYYGPECMQYCRPKNDDYGHYTCDENGNRICLEGWQGRYCDKAVCKPGCHPEHGFCDRPNQCNCSLGFIGELCDQCQRYPGCKHGTCERPWDCICETGWGGLFCNQDLNYCTHHKPCQNGAACTNTGAGHYTCECVPGFTGTNCEVKIEDCSLEPCLNGGSCRETGTNYTCSCLDGYSGRHCQTFAKTCRDGPCENAGTCVDTADGYMCLCPPGWEGENCDTEKDECQPNPCLNGGRCIEDFNGFQCVCPIGFTGDRCEENKNDCSLDTCLNGGTCIDQINSFKCECAPGFIGSLCQHNIDDCIQRPCANGGTCFDLINDYRCMCRPGFKGKDCSIDINECESNPCRNGASCQDTVDDYICHCDACFTGKNCQERNDDCLFESTFRPVIIPYQVTTPTFANSAAPKEWASAKENNSEQSAAIWKNATLGWIIPVLVLFFLLILVLLLVIYCLIRRQNRNLASHKSGPHIPPIRPQISALAEEIYDNELNKTLAMAARKAPKPSLPYPVEIANPELIQKKIDNQTRYATICKVSVTGKSDMTDSDTLPDTHQKLAGFMNNSALPNPGPPPIKYLQNVNIYDETVPDSPGFERKIGLPSGDYPRKHRRRPKSSFAPRSPKLYGQLPPRSQTPPTPACGSGVNTPSGFSPENFPSPRQLGAGDTTDLSVSCCSPPSSDSKDSGLGSPSAHDNFESDSNKHSDKKVDDDLTTPRRSRKSRPPNLHIANSANPTVVMGPNSARTQQHRGCIEVSTALKPSRV